MKPSRENIFRLLARLEQDCGLPEGGPISLFVSDQIGTLRLHPTQLVLRTQGDTVFVRTSRLPFVRPMVFSRQALKIARL
ncbi:MAG: hypothetical protein IJN79_00255 [Clostridia bacterium]|nr:hypothetical protein [Clostridia bacterium]MBQ4609167.1 hypothetical protein [Clostridia bacterium]MBQ7051217.1 hypothetical protein [Clostridia bacterium]